MQDCLDHQELICAYKGWMLSSRIHLELSSELSRSEYVSDSSSLREFILRPVVRHDVPSLLRLIRELAEFENMSSRVTATEEQLQNTLFGIRTFAEGFLGLLNDEAIAYAIVHHTYSTFAARPGLYIEDIHVREAYRGRGFGKRMMQHLAQLSVARGCESMSWSVLGWNQRAIDFYTSLGAGKNTEWESYRIDGEKLQSLAGVK
jgi:ribosomal protein S18 acetylase RimI-like enzyme